MLDKIVAGKVSKNLGEKCLLSQAHMIEEGAPIVGKFIQTIAAKAQLSALKVGTFSRWTIGENLDSNAK
jgi:translation elongation factor EF-Ts